MHIFYRMDQVEKELIIRTIDHIIGIQRTYLEKMK
jgi:hypothetical protein